MVTRFKTEGVDVDFGLLVGHPTAALIEYVDDNPHDLIALASHAHSGLRRWVLGSAKR